MNKHSFNALLEDLKNEDKQVDIFFGTETWLHGKILNPELNLPEYDIMRRDRPMRGGGGVLLGIKKTLDGTLA